MGGSPDVFIGGEQVTYLDIQPEFPPWQRMILGNNDSQLSSAASGTTGKTEESGETRQTGKLLGKSGKLLGAKLGALLGKTGKSLKVLPIKSSDG